jgi:hypothetical protein
MLPVLSQIKMLVIGQDFFVCFYSKLHSQLAQQHSHSVVYLILLFKYSALQVHSYVSFSQVTCYPGEGASGPSLEVPPS